MTYSFDVFEDPGADLTLAFKAKLLVNNQLVATARDSNKKKATEKVSKRAYFKFKESIQHNKS